jgi:hypothetical protein
MGKPPFLHSLLDMRQAWYIDNLLILVVTLSIQYYRDYITHFSWETSVVYVCVCGICVSICIYVDVYLSQHTITIISRISHGKPLLL